MIDKSTKYNEFISFFKEKFKKGDNVIVNRLDMEKNFPELKTEPTEEDQYKQKRFQKTKKKELVLKSQNAIKKQ